MTSDIADRALLGGLGAVQQPPGPERHHVRTDGQDMDRDGVVLQILRHTLLGDEDLLAHRGRGTDGPFFPVCIKGIQALGEIGTPDAEQFLKTLATSAPGEWPDPLRWHAAEQLGIEDELGFDEDQMLGGV